MAKKLISFNKSKRTLHSIHKINTGEKPAGNFWYDSLKYVLVTVKMIRSYSVRAVFS